MKEIAGMLFSKIKASNRFRSLKLVSHNFIEDFWKFFSIYNLYISVLLALETKIFGERYQAGNRY